MLTFRSFLRESASWATINEYAASVFATLTPEQQNMILDYTSTEFYDINTFLHQFSPSGSPLTSTAKKWLDDTIARAAAEQHKKYTPASFKRMHYNIQRTLDGCFARYALPQDIDVMRRVPAHRLFPHDAISLATINQQPTLQAVGDLILAHLRKAGNKIQFPQYLSTSMHVPADEFRSSTDVLLHIHLPRGTKAIPIPETYNQAIVESEIVLPRNTTIFFPEAKNRVVKMDPNNDEIYLYGNV